MPQQSQPNVRDGLDGRPCLPPPSHVPKPVRPAGIACLAILGLCVLAIAFYPEREFLFSGLNDFPAFYLGPGLLAGHDLYSPAAMANAQAKVLGHICENIQYIRLPYFAVMLWPLSLLPYMSAYFLWQFCSLGALAAFVRLWPAKWVLTLLLCCWFPPVAANFANGQDVTFLLLWIAIGTCLVRRNASFAAGLLLSLCAAKFHLLLFLPVLVLAGRFWRLGLGLLAGLAALLAISFAAAGTNWPAYWYSAVRNPAVHSAVADFSILGRLSVVLKGPPLVVAASALVLLIGAAVWICARRADFPLALSVAVAGGTLVAFHVYAQDYLLWLPLLTILSVDRQGGSTLEPSAPHRTDARSLISCR